MATRRGSEFIVKLEGIQLPPTVESRIEQAIRSTVLSQLAQIDFKGDLGASLALRKEWRGLWLAKIANLNVPNQAIVTVGG